MHVLSSEIDKLTLPADCAQRESAVTIGSFDGIHIGHQFLIEQLVGYAHQQGHLSGLVTFYPHPAAVLYPQRPTPSLTTPGEKIVLLGTFGLDWMAIVPFSRELAAWSPHKFIQLLYDRARMRSLWVGPDFALGHNREGNVGTLRELGREMKFEVHEVAYVSQDGQRISSTHIRNLLRHGHAEEAARLLRRYYSISGEVVRGAQRGRCLGFPTANLAAEPERVIPGDGIYAAYACLGSERYPAVVNVGVRPTFDNGARSIEAYLIDFAEDIYGYDLVVEFVAWLRPERRFQDVNDLIAQIERDVEQARRILSSAERSFPLLSLCTPSTFGVHKAGEPRDPT